jgi:outer membrane protein assembly factor BamB
MMALHPQEGRFLWSFEAGGSIHSSPLASANALFFGADDTYLYCLNRSDGALKWKYKTEDRIRSSPSISGNRLYCGGYYIYAFDLVTADEQA